MFGVSWNLLVMVGMVMDSEIWLIRLIIVRVKMMVKMC